MAMGNPVLEVAKSLNHEMAVLHGDGTQVGEVYEHNGGWRYSWTNADGGTSGNEDTSGNEYLWKPLAMRMLYPWPLELRGPAQQVQTMRRCKACLTDFVESTQSEPKEGRCFCPECKCEQGAQSRPWLLPQYLRFLWKRYGAYHTQPVNTKKKHDFYNWLRNGFEREATGGGDAEDCDPQRPQRHQNVTSLAISLSHQLCRTDDDFELDKESECVFKRLRGEGYNKKAAVAYKCRKHVIQNWDPNEPPKKKEDVLTWMEQNVQRALAGQNLIGSDGPQMKMFYYSLLAELFFDKYWSEVKIRKVCLCECDECKKDANGKRHVKADNRCPREPNLPARIDPKRDHRAFMHKDSEQCDLVKCSACDRHFLFTKSAWSDHLKKLCARYVNDWAATNQKPKEPSWLSTKTCYAPLQAVIQEAKKRIREKIDVPVQTNTVPRSIPCNNPTIPCNKPSCPLHQSGFPKQEPLIQDGGSRWIPAGEREVSTEWSSGVSDDDSISDSRGINHEDDQATDN